MEMPYGTFFENRPKSARFARVDTSLAARICDVQGMRLILAIVLILLLLGALPAWPYSAGWGYYPSGGVGLLLLIVLILALTGRRA